jgi:hypothetical protein
VGATYRQTRTIPRSSEEDFEVTDFAPPSRFAVRGQIGPSTQRQLASVWSAGHVGGQAGAPWRYEATTATPVRPPSTSITVPWTNAASSLAR